jgi:Tfp pilus assembly protein PilZ
MTEVSLVTSDSRRFTATSRELSSGGMSMQAADEVSVGQSVELSFALLTLPRTWIRATVSWRKGTTFGVHFDPQDDRRAGIKQWIDSYLES